MNRAWALTAPVLLGAGLLVGLPGSPARGGDPGGAVGQTPAVAPEAAAEAEALQEADAAVPEDHLPRYTEEGALILPESWESWVMVGTSIGLSYSENRDETPEPGEPPGMFHNVYMQPWAYERLREEGAFPRNTMLVMSMFDASQKAEPALGGWYEGEFVGLEAHVKDGRHETGWTFYNFGRSGDVVDPLPPDVGCYACHAEKADHDHVFTQFYPRLRERLAAESGR